MRSVASLTTGPATTCPTGNGDRCPKCGAHISAPTDSEAGGGCVILGVILIAAALAVAGVLWNSRAVKPSPAGGPRIVGQPTVAPPPAPAPASGPAAVRAQTRPLARIPSMPPRRPPRPLTLEHLRKLGPLERLTVDGTTFEDVTWTRVSRSTVSFLHRSGASSIPIVELLPALKQQYHFEPPAQE